MNTWLLNFKGTWYLQREIPSLETPGLVSHKVLIKRFYRVNSSTKSSTDCPLQSRVDDIVGGLTF